MRKCPHCKKKISETAKKCKFCWEWVDEKEDTVNIESDIKLITENIENVTTNKQKEQNDVLKILIIAFVIFITLILIAALMPRMSSAQWRARDVARQNDLSQMMAAIVTYQGDHGGWPWADRAKNQIPVSGIKSELMSAWLISIPSDPSSWEYTYMVWDNWLLLMANTETEAWSNWVVCSDGNWLDKWHITNDTDFDKIYLCDEVTEWESCSVSTCTYTSKDQLRYIYTRHFIKEEKEQPSNKNNTPKKKTKNSSKSTTQPTNQDSDLSPWVSREDIENRQKIKENYLKYLETHPDAYNPQTATPEEKAAYLEEYYKGQNPWLRNLYM